MAPIDERWREGPGLLESVWRHRYLVVAVTVLGALAGFGLGQLQPVVYEASAQLRLVDPRNLGVFETRATNPDLYILQQEDLATSRAVVERAAELAGEDVSPGSISRRTSVQGDPELLILHISAEGSSGQRAADYANALGTAYQQVATERIQRDADKVIGELLGAQEAVQARINELQGELGAGTAPDTANPATILLQARIQSLVGQLVELESRAQQVFVDAEVIGSGVEVFEEASVPQRPVAPRPVRLGILTAFLAAGVAAALAYWLAGRRSRVEDRHDPAEVLGAPLLGQVPTMRRASADTLADDIASIGPGGMEAYQFVLSSLAYALQGSGGSTVLVTSARAGQGKTGACLQIGAAAARDGRRVLLVDGDLRARSLTRLMRAGYGLGLADAATNDVPVERCLHRRVAGEDGLRFSVIPTGPLGSSDFLHTPGFTRAMSRIRDAADLVVVDSAPLLAVANTTVLAGHVDGVVLVVGKGTSFDDLHRVRERLQFVSAPLLGYLYVQPDLDVSTYAYFVPEAELKRQRRRRPSPAGAAPPPYARHDDAEEQPDPPRDASPERTRRIWTRSDLAQDRQGGNGPGNPDVADGAGRVPAGYEPPRVEVVRRPDDAPPDAEPVAEVDAVDTVGIELAGDGAQGEPARTQPQLEDRYLESWEGDGAETGDGQPGLGDEEAVGSSARRRRVWLPPRDED